MLARKDAGCMSVSGGICPGHANIGRFIHMHNDLITGAFFERVTRSVLQSTGTNGHSLSGDSTAVEAACCHYKLLKAEAMQAKALAAPFGEGVAAKSNPGPTGSGNTG